MSESIVLKTYRTKVDKKYVGFPPNGSSIKPVHIAGGSLRTLYGACNTTMNIKRLALVSDSKGNVPKGNELTAIYEQLSSDEEIEEGIAGESLESMRNVMQKLISADKGVYVVKGLKDGMISYSAGSKYFLARHAMYEDAGEFIGGLIQTYCPNLAEYVKKVLDGANDPISLLFEPVLEAEMESFEGSKHDELPAFTEMNSLTQWFVDGLKESGECLKSNLEKHPNTLTQLRLFNFFCILQVIRYMSLLASFYCGETVRPILLDFSKLPPSQSSVARASEMSYTQLYKSLNRFYAWAYASELDGFDKDSLLKMDPPVYEENKQETKASREEINAIWNLAKERVQGCSDDAQIKMIFGEAMYDILALEATSHPIAYLRALGTASGVLYPPDRLHPNKRFVFSQDMLETIMRCCVLPDEVLSSDELRNRLWDRFGIVIGGRTFEMGILQKSGMIIQVDEDSLEDNFSAFANELEAMDFAEMMADGILQIRMGGKQV